MRAPPAAWIAGVNSAVPYTTWVMEEKAAVEKEVDVCEIFFLLVDIPSTTR